MTEHQLAKHETENRVARLYDQDGELRLKLDAEGERAISMPFPVDAAAAFARAAAQHTRQAVAAAVAQPAAGDESTPAQFGATPAEEDV